MKPSNEMNQDYRASHVGVNTGKTYHKQFFSEDIRAIYWILEKAILKNFRKCLPEKKLNCLDFATGTGRVAKFMHDLGDGVIGVDVSVGMLKEAKKSCPGPRYLKCDITRDEIPEISQNYFDIILAFRFFPNAEPKLRQEALVALSKYLKDDGYLIVNHHRNPKSLWRRISIFSGGPRCDLDSVELIKLIESYGFVLAQMTSIGYLPVRNAWKIRTSLILPIEMVLVKLLGWSQLGQQIVYIFHKVG